MNVPDKLKSEKIRYIKIQKGKKRPSESNWQTTQNYSYKEMKAYLKNADTYGVLCGEKSNNLAVIDCDKKELASAILMGLPSTFTVQTGSQGFHFYYFIQDLDKKIVLQTEKEHFGEVQFTKAQVIGANSKHPNGNIYKVVHDNKIASITASELTEVVKPFRKIKKVNYSTNKGFDLDIAEVAKLIPGLDATTEGLQGANPQHGSSNGNNFCVNLEKGTWYCHRHQTGGDALYLVALVENLVKCKDILPGYFKSNPKVFKQTLKIAREKYGYDIPIKKDIVELFTGEKSNKLNVQGIVEYILENYTFVTIRDETSKKPHIYIYRDGYYRLNGDMEIEKIIKELFDNVPWKSFYRNEIMEYIKTENIVDRDAIHPPSHLINVNNGIYNLKTYNLEPHNSKYYFLYKIPIDYTPQAAMPRIMQYFESTLRPEYVDLSQEVFGYCLYFSYPIHGIIYLFGKGGNGKSVYTHLLTKMLGDTNTANKEIGSLMNNRFSSSALYGKLANICGELSTGVLKNTDMLKRLSAGDPISAEFKGKDAFDFYNRAKIITACNEIPMCDDTSDGWIQRQYIIPFLKQFRKTKDDDVHLKTRLTNDKAEMEGLLLWSLQGLKRLLKKNQFSYDYNMEERYNMYQRNSQYFIENTYIKGNFDDFIEVQDIRDAYKNWCDMNTVPMDSNISLARKFDKLEYRLDRIRKEDGEQVWVRRYLKEM